MENVHAVIVSHCLDVLHASMNHFNFNSANYEYLFKGAVFRDIGIC